MLERIVYTFGAGIWTAFFTDKMIIVVWGMSIGLLLHSYFYLKEKLEELK